MASKRRTVRFKWLLVVAAVFAAPLLLAQRQQDDVVMRAMKDELARRTFGGAAMLGGIGEGSLDNKLRSNPA
jgi:hypothetical protein